jgi:hypothetical protein
VNLDLLAMDDRDPCGATRATSAGSRFTCRLWDRCQFEALATIL